MKFCRYLVWWMLVVSGTQACSVTSPAQQAERLGMVTSTATGTLFQLRLYQYSSNTSNTEGRLLVVIEGDGKAFLDRYTVARDPTPRRSKALALAADLASFGDTLVIGRPCYHQVTSTNCHPRYWTTARYSRQVVDSMVHVLEHQAAGRRVWLLGYSGGGVLAMLIAASTRLPVQGVLTIAAPLDVGAWTSLHEYTPLAESIDPADDPARFRHLCQRHLYGEQDKTVPSALLSQWRWPSENTNVIKNFTHHADWSVPVLAELGDMLAGCSHH